MLVVGHEEGGEDAPNHQKYRYLEPNEIPFYLRKSKYLTH